MSVVIIDYNMGNLRSIQKRFEKNGRQAIISNNFSEIEKADKLILPGVGHFKIAMNKIEEMGLKSLLDYKVLEQKTPILGICLGMQLMAKHSEEGNANGLGWFDANVLKFNIQDKLKYKIPHIGWNDIEIQKNNPLFKGIEESKKFYFVHSYHIVCCDTNDILTKTEYEYTFTSSIWRDNIFGVQFHPEKSHEQGDILLSNFYQI